MADPYFRYLPEFEYVNRTKEGRSEGDYSVVKNLFKRAKLREDIYQEITFFTKFIVQGDDRPDNVAAEVYGDPNLDWVVLLSNNIVNIYNEWPLNQQAFENYVLDKYGTVAKLDEIHHYESNEVKDMSGIIIFPKGVRVSAAQSVSYFEPLNEEQITVNPVSKAVTNYQHEQSVNDKKRRIFLIKPIYLNVVFDDLEEMMEYKKGSTQFVSKSLKRADNIRLFE